MPEQSEDRLWPGEFRDVARDAASRSRLSPRLIESGLLASGTRWKKRQYCRFRWDNRDDGDGCGNFPTGGRTTGAHPGIDSRCRASLRRPSIRHRAICIHSCALVCFCDCHKEAQNTSESTRAIRHWPHGYPPMKGPNCTGRIIPAGAMHCRGFTFKSTRRISKRDYRRIRWWMVDVFGIFILFTFRLYCANCPYPTWG